MFKDYLNSYLEKLNCTTTKLANITNINKSVISRYRNGTRTPKPNSNQLNNLINALIILNQENNNILDNKEIETNLRKSLNKDEFDYNTLSNNLNELINGLNINLKDMSKYISFDSSYISRVRYNKIKPSEPLTFINKISNYIKIKYTSETDLNTLKEFFNQDNIIDLEKLVKDYLLNNKSNNYISDFLINLDNFDLNDYIKVIKFDELKVPNLLIYHVKNKNYYGLEEMKKAEIDFFKAAVLSKNKSDIYMMSDMKMEDMASDIEFGKKWMLGIAFCLKKGIHINIIHNLDRPFKEMILGLESWIPLYMTGLINPFYLKDYKDNVFEHLNYFKYPISLTGEAIKGHHEKGKYYLTTNLKEINYYQEKTNNLFKKALPLMEIYNNSSTNSFKSFLNNSLNIKEKRERYLTSLPIFTIENNLLLSILKRNNLNDDEINKILDYKKEEENNINLILENNIIIDNCYEFDNSYLALENIFYEKKIYYTKTEFNKHLKSTKEYAKKNKNYFLNISNNKVFKNINITILTNNYVIVSKSNNPVIHFVIKHEKLMNAITNFYPIVKE